MEFKYCVVIHASDNDFEDIVIHDIDIQTVNIIIYVAQALGVTEISYSLER